MKTIPLHTGAPLWGGLNEFRHDQLGFLMRMHNTYGDIVQIPMFTQKVILLSHPDLIHAILVTHADRVTKSDLDHRIFRRSMGSGLLASEGEFHTRQRRLMQPAFHHRRIEAYGRVTTDFTNRMMQGWGDRQMLDMHEAMTKLTLFIVSKVLYDADVSEHADGIGSAVHTLNHEGEEQYKQGFVLPSWIPTRQNRDVDSAVKRVNTIILPIIEARRASGEDRGDLLSMLLAAQDEETATGMTDQQVRDEAVTMFMAGHETTSNALAWTWYLLGQHPQAAARLRAELDQVLDGRPPTTADLPNLKYTDWVIKESMRLYPPAWILNGRTPQEDIEIDGYLIERGTVIFISPYVQHRDARSFDEPDMFRPERWANDFEKSIPRYAYFPFGGGPRVCIGSSFAQMEARLVLATVAQRWDVMLDPTQAVRPEPLVTLRPKDGVRVCLAARQG